MHRRSRTDLSLPWRLGALPTRLLGVGLMLTIPFGASMFIAAFVAGLAAKWRYPRSGGHSVEFAEAWGLFEPRMALYAALSLTIVRMLPVAVALAGTRLSVPTVAFIGWLGRAVWPRSC